MWMGEGGCDQGSGGTLLISRSKFVVGYMPVCGEKEYYLACACGELYAPPSAYVAVFGLTVQQTFLGGNFLYDN